MDRVWDKASDIIKEKISRQNFETWFRPVKLMTGEAHHLVLGVPNKFFKEWLIDNYYQTIRDSLKDASGTEMSFEFIISKSKEEPPPQTGDDRRDPERSKPVNKRINNSLNPNYSFERFVVGSSNQFAHAASISVAERPAQNYNPLFIYGGVGLGKTHLINAIGLRALNIYSNLNVIYISAEEFMNELINCIRFDKMQKFREKYRNIGCLLIDDIQFIAGKERTQEEFFHTFNTLHDSGRQIVVTSDKFPRDIPNLEGRLRSRFEWGLITDIQPPDIETKIAILVKKAQENQIALPHQIAFYIASQAESNIRELEGYLTRISAFASVTDREIDLHLVKEALKKVIKNQKYNEFSVEEIVKTVGNKLNVKLVDLKSEHKNKNLVLARQIAMYLARKLTSASFPDIGEKIGGRDHSTVIYAVNKIAKAITTDEKLKHLVNDLEEVINAKR